MHLHRPSGAQHACCGPPTAAAVTQGGLVCHQRGCGDRSGISVDVLQWEKVRGVCIINFVPFQSSPTDPAVRFEHVVLQLIDEMT